MYKSNIILWWYTVGCWGVVQLGGPGPWHNCDGPAKVGAHNYWSLINKILDIIPLIPLFTRSMPIV